MLDPRLQEIDLDDLVLRWPPWLGFGIRGVEVTQAVQYYDSDEHLTDAADRQPDNAVTLVAGKPAWVRVFVRSGWRSGDIAGVTGTISVRRREFGFIYLPAGTLTAQPPGSVTARRNPPYATERGSLGYTLNFIIPASMMCGHLRLDISIQSPRGWTDERRVYIDATLQQTVRLAGIMVGYNGPSSTAPGAPNVVRAAPALADLQTTSAWTLTTFPVRAFATYRTAGTVTWNLPLTDAPSCPGCCTPNWVALNTAVQQVRIADGNRTDVLYYGLMAAGIPMGPIIGCNSGGVSTGSIGDGVTMAHELGHACGRPHSPCGTPGDAAYPAYEPYDPAGTPMASIGEYGLDINTGAIKSPATFKDFMSYCAPKWISLFVTGRLTNNAALDPVRVCEDRPWWFDEILVDRQLIPEKWLPDPPPEIPGLDPVVTPQPVISIIGVLHGPNQLEVRSIVRLDAETAISNGRALDLRAELVGRRGDVVASGQLYALRSYAHGGGCGCDDDGGGDESDQTYPRLVQGFVSNVEPGIELRIMRGEEPIFSRKAATRRPKVGATSAKLDGDRLYVSWAPDVTGEVESEALVQWTPDRGRTWHGMGAGLAGDSAVLDASGLPSGRIGVRILVSDGFFTATSRTLGVAIPQRPVQVSILSPFDGQTFAAGSPMRLWGSTMPASDESADADQEAAVWVVDGDDAATGLDAFVTAPRPGNHRAVLRVRGRGRGRQGGEAVVRFRTVEYGEERDAEPDEKLPSAR